MIGHAKRYLIVNADDFGQSDGVNRGIIKAHRYGIVTSASLMVRWPAACAAAAYARAHPQLALGLHVDLGEQLYRDGDWVPRYTVVALDDEAAIADEVGRQLELFHRLVGRGPSHLDSHQHVHLREPMRTVLIDIAKTLALPLRHYCPAIGYRGDFYGQTAEGWPLPEAISVQRLMHILETLPPGYTELACHPGEGRDLDTTYRDERAVELLVLCDPRVRTAINALDIELRSFWDLARA
ncbi:MAG TPA: ChbG/HpnK family deacetylase [Alphaproteobacteria bacterium]|nr:ChbG/HpnK family deacetylase [Alphaproteobacteria bacterium]